MAFDVRLLGQNRNFNLTNCFTQSVHLSRVLDEIGLNELTVKRRRECLLQKEALHSVGLLLTGYNASSYIFGSQSEGTTTPGLYSDVDILHCYNDVNVIQDLSQRQTGKLNLLMIQEEDTAPGYCRLELLSSDEALPQEYLDHLYKELVYDNCNRGVLKNTFIYSLKSHKETRHGPAFTHTIESISNSVDTVAAFKYDTWPVQARPWLKRRRPGHCPSRQKIKLTTETGCFVVPVGHRLSSTECLEWRISPSLTERNLMFSLNIVQIKCYIILKMIAKLFLKPHISDGSISSYILKTAVLYAIENTSSFVWKETHLLQCVTHCLCILHAWVAHCYAPNYFIPGDNLFAGRLTQKDKTTMKNILTVLIVSNGSYVTNISIDNIGDILEKNMLHKQEILLFLPSLQSLQVVLDFKFTLQCLLQATNNIILRETHCLSVTQVIQLRQSFIPFLFYTYNQADTIKKLAVKSFIYLQFTMLGSLKASVSINNNQRIPWEAIYWFYIGTYSDVATSRLKLASAFYCSGDTETAAQVLQDLEKRYRVGGIQPICGCGEGYNLTLTKAFKRHCSTPSTYNNNVNELIAHCVVFTRHEFSCTPHALRYEMFRSPCDDDDLGLILNWMECAAVDSLPYLYYLQYLTYRQQQKGDLKDQALNKLHECILGEPNLAHLETAWNLLGHCMEQEQKTEAAITCYRRSLEVRPRNNAAKWLLSIVLSKMFCSQ